MSKIQILKITHQTESESASKRPRNVYFLRFPDDTNEADLYPHIWEPLGYLTMSYLDPNEQSSTLHCGNHNILFVVTTNLCNVLVFP